MDKETKKSFNALVEAHSKVLQSVIKQEGIHGMKEVMEINNGFGKQIGARKLWCEAYKVMGIKPTKEDLLLDE